MPVLMENPLPSGPARMKHRSVWHGLMGSWDISFSRMLKYSVFYTVQSFDVFDNIEGSPLQQVMNENTTLGVISALLFSTLFPMALDQESMKRFSGSQQWILEDLGNFSFFLAALMFAMSSMYCSLVIAFACQVKDDFETMVWKDKIGMSSSYGIIMFMMGLIPTLIGAGIHAITLCTSAILTGLILFFWLVVGGFFFCYLGLTTMVWGLYQTKHQVGTLPCVGLELNEAKVKQHFESYFGECSNNPNLLGDVTDFQRFVIFKESQDASLPMIPRSRAIIADSNSSSSDGSGGNGGGEEKTKKNRNAPPQAQMRLSEFAVRLTDNYFQMRLDKLAMVTEQGSSI